MPIYKYIFAFVLCSTLTNTAAFSFKFVQKDAKGTHVHAPFVHVDVSPPSPNGKRVKVQAPLVKVDNPPGKHNASVKAPFTTIKSGTADSTKNSSR